MVSLTIEKPNHQITNDQKQIEANTTPPKELEEGLFSELSTLVGVDISNFTEGLAYDSAWYGVYCFASHIMANYNISYQNIARLVYVVIRPINTFNVVANQAAYIDLWSLRQIDNYLSSIGDSKVPIPENILKLLRMWYCVMYVIPFSRAFHYDEKFHITEPSKNKDIKRTNFPILMINYERTAYKVKYNSRDFEELIQ